MSPIPEILGSVGADERKAELKRLQMDRDNLIKSENRVKINLISNH